MPSSALTTTSAIIALGLIATPTQAADATLRLQGQLVNTSLNTLVLVSDFGSEPGVYLGAEFRLNDRFGIEAGVGWFELEERSNFFGTEFTESLTVIPVAVALNIHLTRQKRYDLYVAPKIGWAFFDDFELTQVNVFFPEGFTTEIPTEDQFIFGLRLGFDFPFGQSSWGFSSSIDYTDIDFEFDVSGFTDGLDPLSVGAGVAYSF